MTAFTQRQFQMARETEQSLHFRRLDPPEPVGTVLYIHGLGESGLCYERLMADSRLAAWRHEAVDLAGYGKSGWTEAPLSLSEHATGLAAWVEQHLGGPLVIVGHSMGGVIGTFLCERLGEKVHGFINVEGNISSADCGYSGQALKFDLAEWLDRGFDEVLDAIYAHDGESVEVRRAYGASILMCDPRAYHRNSEDLVAISRSETLAQRLAAIAAPKLYVHGVPRGICQRSLELLANHGVACVAVGGADGAGHWPFLDQHDSFVEAMVAFLAALPAGRAR